MDVVQNLTPGKNGSNRFVERKHKPPQTHAQPLIQARALVFVRAGFYEKNMQAELQERIINS